VNRTTIQLLLMLLGALAALPSGAYAQVQVQPGDLLQITVWPSTELSGEFTVEESGLVYLPLIGEVRVGGVAIDQVRADLRRRYGEVVRNPVVTVTPVFPVTITGEIQRPGVHMVTPGNSLFDVVGMAGGFREAADGARVRVVRPGSVVEFDALRALQTGEGMDAIQLQSGDHVVVPRGRAPWTWRDALYVVQTISTLVLLVDRFR
jgi:polysaccharide biosynthesis/export protein